MAVSLYSGFLLAVVLIPYWLIQFADGVATSNLLESVPPGTDVKQLTSNLQNVEYYVTRVTSLGQSQPGLFKMSSDLGLMKTAMKLDRDQGYVKYTVEVYVRDKSSGSPRTAKADVSSLLLAFASFGSKSRVSMTVLCGVMSLYHLYHHQC